MHRRLNRAGEIAFRLASIAIMVAGVSGFTGAQSVLAHELPRHSIVDGQRLQPREDDLKSVGRPDVTPSQAAEIDHLYRQLLHCAEHRCTVPDDSSGNSIACGAFEGGYRARC
jgi:hypothetical protein